jgi:hypothetical protein
MDEDTVSQEEADRFYVGMLDLWHRFDRLRYRLPWRTRLRIWVMIHLGWG